MMKWDSSLDSAKILKSSNSGCQILRTIYKRTFLIEKRQFVEKQFISKVDKLKTSDNSKVTIYSSSISESLSKKKENTILGTRVMKIVIINYFKAKDRTTITIFDQSNYGLKNFDSFFQNYVPKQLKKLQEDLGSYIEQHCA